MLHHGGFLPDSPDPAGLPLPRWVVGVTTAPRRETTLGPCLESLRRAGFGDFRVFAEPHSPLPDGITVTHRTGRLGAWGNFLLGLHELVLRHPQADMFLMIQDDVLLAPYDLHAYLAGLRWPATLGLVSLFLSAAYPAPPGWLVFPGAVHPGFGRWLWSGQALALPRWSVLRVLATAGVLTHHYAFDNRIDYRLGVTLQHAGLDVYLPVPSLAQHIGDTSTIWGSRERAAGFRRARDTLV